MVLKGRHFASVKVLLAGFLLVGAMVFGTGCTTIRTAEVRGNESYQTKHFLPIPASRAQEGSGLVLLTFDLKGLSADRSCRWRMINKETGKSYFITVKTDDTHALAQLEPGEYEAGRFGCGIARVWNLNETFPGGIRVEGGRLSYLGKLVFEFSGAELESIRHVSRYESASGFVRAIEAEGLTNWPAISAFTGKTIDRSMIASGEARDGFDIFAKGVSNPSTILAPLISDLKGCVQKEGSTDPLRFGHLEYTAIYREGRFAEMKDRLEANGFSDRLRSCVERGIMAFHIDEKSREVEVRVRY